MKHLDPDPGREPQSEQAPPSRGAHLGRRLRSCVLATSTLAVAAAGAGTLLALSGTAVASSSASPAPAKVTRESNGTVLVRFSPGPGAWVVPAEEALAKMGLHEQISIGFLPGAARVKGAIACPAFTGAARPPAGQPAVRVLFGDDGTAELPAGNSGVGGSSRLVHLNGCNTQKSVSLANIGKRNPDYHAPTGPTGQNTGYVQ